MQRETAETADFDALSLGERIAHDFQNLLQRQVGLAIERLRLYNEPGVREVDRKISVRRSNQTAENENGSTECRQRNSNILLNPSPDTSGRLPDKAVSTVHQAARIINGKS